MGGFKYTQLKSNEEIEKLFEIEMKRVNSFIPIDSEVEKSKVKVDDEAKLKKHIEIVRNDDVAIDAIPLATKPPVIIEYKIVKEGIFGHFQLIRADGSSKRPKDEYEKALWGDLNVMFEPDRMSEVEFFKGWKPLSPLQLAVEEVIWE
ncbi:hypothetical protein Tco_0133916 [Tanacetum coccineum]